jgi:hypothetical protein
MVDIKELLLLNNVLCGRSFWAVDNIEGHPCAFREGFETLGLNCGMMNKYIFAAVHLNKTKTFCIVKPLYCTFSHLEILLCAGSLPLGTI